MVRDECFCFGLTKDIGVLVVFFWNGEEVDFLGDGSGFGLYCETCKGDWAQDSRRILSDITDCSYDTTHL